MSLDDEINRSLREYFAACDRKFKENYDKISAELRQMDLKRERSMRRDAESEVSELKNVLSRATEIIINLIDADGMLVADRRKLNERVYALLDRIEQHWPKLVAPLKIPKVGDEIEVCINGKWFCGKVEYDKKGCLQGHTTDGSFFAYGIGATRNYWRWPANYPLRTTI